MAQTIGSFDLASLKNLRDDVTQYFWFESDSSSAWGSGAHVTLYPESQFTDSTSPNYMKGQNIIMNTDGFSIRNGGLPMMVLDNDSLDFNAVDTTQGTYVTMATFGLTGATIGQSGAAHSIIDADGQRFYASDGTTQLANIGYGTGTNDGGGTSTAPYYSLGSRTIATQQYNPSATYNVGDVCLYDGKTYVCKTKIETPETWTQSHWEYSIGNYSFSGGYNAIAAGYSSIAEGNSTKAIGSCSHAEGYRTIALGDSSHAAGVSTITNPKRDAQTVIGQYNIQDTSAPDILQRGGLLLIIGNGIGIHGADNERSNALTVDWYGKINCGNYSGTFKSIFDIFYPVGSYYETSLPSSIPSGSSTPNATDLANLGVTWFNPQYAWGGTWELETSGQFHISAGTGYALGSAAGNKDAIIPYHRHNVAKVTGGITGGSHSHATYRKQNAGSGTARYIPDADSSANGVNTNSKTHTHDLPQHYTDYVGTSDNVTNANLPPYIAVNRWHRTA